MLLGGTTPRRLVYLHLLPHNQHGTAERLAQSRPQHRERSSSSPKVAEDRAEEHVARVSMVGCMRHRHPVRLQKAGNSACLELAMTLLSLRGLEICGVLAFRGARLAQYPGSVRCQL